MWADSILTPGTLNGLSAAVYSRPCPFRVPRGVSEEVCQAQRLSTCCRGVEAQFDFLEVRGFAYTAACTGLRSPGRALHVGEPGITVGADRHPEAGDAVGVRIRPVQWEAFQLQGRDPQGPATPLLSHSAAGSSIPLQSGCTFWEARCDARSGQEERERRSQADGSRQRACPRGRKLEAFKSPQWENVCTASAGMPPGLPAEVGAGMLAMQGEMFENKGMSMSHNLINLLSSGPSGRVVGSS